MQIPSLVQEVFECSLTLYPLSKSIFHSFQEFLFEKFLVPADSRLDIGKLTRAIRTKAYKYPLQEMRLHPSRDFQVGTPPLIAEILDTMAAEAASNPKMQPPSATPPAASVAVVSLLPRKASPTHHLTPAPALVQASFSQQQAFDFVFQSLPTLLFLTVTNFLLPLTQSMHPLLDQRRPFRMHASYFLFWKLSHQHLRHFSLTFTSIALHQIIMFLFQNQFSIDLHKMRTDNWGE